MGLAYEPLDASKDEIRLLTLLPRSQNTRTRRTDIIRCKLEKRSLISLTREYEAHVASLGSSSSNKHKSRRKWLESCPEPNAVNPALSSSTAGEPPTEHQRFVWGDYAALSYVWGNENRGCKIIVNDHEIEVTPNLAAALLTFRDGGEFHSNFGLWVDAICINQEDLEERGKQVRKMRDIYGKAWTVIAWLGEENEQSDKAIQLIRELSKSHGESNYDLGALAPQNPCSLVDGSWYALNKLMQRRYWSRLWIIQEIVMGAFAMVIRCGGCSVNWNTFCAGIDVLQERFWVAKDNFLQLEVTWAGGGFGRNNATWSTTSLHLVYRDLSVLSERDEDKDAELPFWQLIDIANSAESSDPRDLVYGLIGLMGDKVGKQLVPNYKLSPREVYTEASKAFIQSYQSLDPIREGNPWGPTKTSSWVADWLWHGARLSQARIENRLWGPAWLSGKREPDSSNYKAYEASLGSTCDFSFLGNGLMECTGFIIDTIAGLSARGRGFFAWSETSIIQGKEWSSIYGDIGDTSKALCRTLLADRVGKGQKPSDRHAVILNLPSTFDIAEPQFLSRSWEWLASQERYYFRWEEWRKANRNFQLGDRRLDDFFNDAIPPEATYRDVTEVYACFDRTSQKRRFMITQKGYMGWAPDNIYGSLRDQTRTGDLITILFGCSTPIVVRPHGKHFQVIGEAYVQGVMDGEAMEILRNGTIEARRFTFC